MGLQNITAKLTRRSWWRIQVIGIVVYHLSTGSAANPKPVDYGPKGCSFINTASAILFLFFSSSLGRNSGAKPKPYYISRIWRSWNFGSPTTFSHLKASQTHTHIRTVQRWLKLSRQSLYRHTRQPISQQKTSSSKVRKRPIRKLLSSTLQRTTMASSPSRPMELFRRRQRR